MTFHPTLDEIRKAAETIGGVIPLPTPLLFSSGLSKALGAEVFLKLETMTPIGSFKLRGGIHLISEMHSSHRASGVITASTGNHGQSIAYAAACFSVKAHIVVPIDANPDKVSSIKQLGADVIFFGERFDDARREAERLADTNGYLYIHPAERGLIAGVGSAAIEVLEVQAPETEIVVVPVGGGSGACGWIAARDGLQHEAEIWATQSLQAPAVHDSWRSGHLLERSNTTFAEGLATAMPFEDPLSLLRQGLNDFLVVDDSAIADAMRKLIDLAHILAEPAGACSVAAAYQSIDRIRDRRIVLVISGANVTREQLKSVL